jgi:hypothetical protein
MGASSAASAPAPTASVSADLLAHHAAAVLPAIVEVEDKPELVPGTAAAATSPPP